MTDQGKHAPPDDGHALDRYVDGLMSESEAAAFLRSIDGDPDAHAQIAAHRALVGELRAAFAGGGAGAPLALSTYNTSRTSRRRAWLAVAAVVALVAAVAINVLPSNNTTEPRSRVVDASKSPLQRANLEFARQVAAGMRPEIVCTTPQQFAEWTEQKLGEPLKPGDLPQGVTLAGWSYAPVFTSYTAVLLAHSGTEPVVVLMDAFANAESLPPEGASDGIYRFRRRIGSIEMVEISRLNEAVILPRLEAAASMPGTP
ncbi:MAG: hypothetical protein K2X32_08865 [Phycisphaerales bacterium]|nr:hypothetical protein [Phycisphaerales bacterium]